MKQSIFLILLIGLFSCEEEIPVPKPPTYLRLELPDHNYELCDTSQWYQFDKGTQYKFQVKENLGDSIQKAELDLGPLNGSIYFHYWRMKKPLSFYINNANDEVDRHKIKADKIEDKQVLRSRDRVFGTLFSLQGDVATPFQFYLTDSTDQFLYAEILFNSRPNYDSLRPSLEYLKVDLEKLLESFEWKQK